MNISKLYTFIIALVILHIVGCTHAMQEPSWTYHYTYQAGKDRPNVGPKTKHILTFSPKAIKDTQNYINSTNWSHKNNPLELHIATFYREGLFEDHNKQNDEPGLLLCIGLFKNKLLDKKPSNNLSFEVELCIANNIGTNNALYDINNIGKEQNKNIILDIGTTEAGLKDIRSQLDTARGLRKNIKIIRFFPINEKESFSTNTIEKIEHIEFKVTSCPYAGCFEDDELYITMCLDSDPLSIHNFFTEHITHHAKKYCDKLASMETKPEEKNLQTANQEEVRKKQARIVAEKSAKKTEKDRIAAQQQALAKATAERKELERQQEAKKIAEIEKTAREKVEAERIAAEKAEAERIATQKEEQRKKQQEEKLEGMRAAAKIAIEKAKKNADELAAAAEKAAQTRKRRIYATLCTGGVIAGCVYLATCLLYPQQAENHFSYVLSLIESWYSRLISKLA